MSVTLDECCPLPLSVVAARFVSLSLLVSYCLALPMHESALSPCLALPLAVVGGSLCASTD